MIAALLASVIAAAPAAGEPAAMPKPLAAMAQAKKKDGTQVLNDAQRAFLARLPERSQKQLSDAIDNQLLGSAEQLKNLVSLEPTPAVLELIATDNCILCHTDPGNQKPRALFSPDPAAQKSNPLLDLKEFVSDVHFRRGLSCSGCHGGKPTDDVMSKDIAARWPKEADRHADRAWIPEFCARCHSDPAFMRGFNPTMPTDQLAKFRESGHGRRLLVDKDSRAAQCVSCHGVHGIRGPKSRKSTVNAQRLPETCGACHADEKHMAGVTLSGGKQIPTTQLAEYKASVHGKALLERGDLGAPSCNGCHGSHAAMPVAVASVAQVCRRCHAQNGALFDGSSHKAAFEKNKWPECGQCHGHHAISKTSEAMIGVEKGQLCFDCHDQFAGASKDKCVATAKHFRATLDSLAEGKKEIAERIEPLAERGLDVEPLTQAVSEVNEALVSARARIHRFDRGAFDEPEQQGQKALAKARTLADEARREHRFRRNGLLGALGAVALLAIGIALKLRDLDKKREGPR